MRSSETFVREWAERVLKKIIEGKGELDKEGGEVAPPFASFLYLPLQALEKLNITMTILVDCIKGFNLTCETILTLKFIFTTLPNYIIARSLGHTCVSIDPNVFLCSDRRTLVPCWHLLH